MPLSILALIEAGAVRENDDLLTLIQGVDLATARSIANWLSLATEGDVKLQFMDLETGVHIIERSYADTLASIKHVDASKPGAPA